MASLASAAPGLFPFKVPCSSISGNPCICPTNTQYNESTTTAIIGATASDVEAVINDYFSVSWAGYDLVMVQGPDNFPGLSIRDLNMTTAVGTYIFSERVRIQNIYYEQEQNSNAAHNCSDLRSNVFILQLVFRFVFPDGSFEQRSEQRGVIPYLSGNGSFSGHWHALKSDRIFENETLVRFTRYFCQTGNPIDFAAFDQIALSNVTSVLTATGKLNGVSTDPVSAQRF
ncbi:hypothetical protein F4679DRAFT_583727 [Xylaria curta]|nr:hypothetical protein F4679DRAFT_583727 [Xylaria curta]